MGAPATLKTCSCCGKQYIPIPGSIFKLSRKGKTYSFCSYNCYRKLQKLKEAKQYDEMDEILSKYHSRK